MTAEQRALLKEVMNYEFVEKELNLFLDTHPTDKKALEMHKAVAQKLKELTDKYQKTYGPLTSNASMNTERWDWIESPWPWEQN